MKEAYRFCSEIRIVLHNDIIPMQCIIVELKFNTICSTRYARYYLLHSRVAICFPPF